MGPVVFGLDSVAEVQAQYMATSAQHVRTLWHIINVKCQAVTRDIT